MAVKIIENASEKTEFNQKANHPLQSWEWGEARKKMGIEVLRIGEYSNNQITNVFQISLHKIPYTSYKIGYLPRSVFPTKEVLDFLTFYGTKNKVVFLKLEPYIQNKVTIKQFNNLNRSPHPLFPKWTQLVDLNQSEDELFKKMHSKTRYNIRLAQRKQVIVKEMSSESGFEEFIKLYFATCKRQKYFGHDYFYHKTVWTLLKTRISHIFTAYFQNIPLASNEIFVFKDTAYYVYGGTSLIHRNFMAANLLMWETIKFAKNLGVKKFDMWGSLPPRYDSNHSWAGFTRFKEGYGGDFVEFAGSFDLVIDPVAYRLYNYIYTFRNLILRILR